MAILPRVGYAVNFLLPFAVAEFGNSNLELRSRLELLRRLPNGIRKEALWVGDMPAGRPTRRISIFVDLFANYVWACLFFLLLSIRTEFQMDFSRDKNQVTRAEV